MRDTEWSPSQSRCVGALVRNYGTRGVYQPHVTHRCIWKGGGGDIWAALQRVGCSAGPIVAIEPALRTLLEGEGEADEWLLSVVENCCLKGSAERQGGAYPPLPFPTDVEIMLGSVLPWLLKSDGIGTAAQDTALAPALT